MAGKGPGVTRKCPAAALLAQKGSIKEERAQESNMGVHERCCWQVRIRKQC